MDAGVFPLKLHVGGEMKLNLIFALIDIAILVAYPFVFVAGKLRQIFKVTARHVNK
jgi:hypothetical protein